MNIFFRVCSTRFDPCCQFGVYESIKNIEWKIGDTIENAYATPSPVCAGRMLGWNNDKAWEYGGGIVGHTS